MIRLSSSTLGLLVVMFCSGTAQAKAGTVRLKNGGWVEGEIMAVVPEQEVLVRLADGSVRTLAWADVARVEEAQAAAAMPAAPTVQPTLGPVQPTAAEPPHVEASLLQVPRVWLSAYGLLAAGGDSGNVLAGFSSDPRFSGSAPALVPSFGVGAQLNYAFNPVLALGVLGQFTSWRAESTTHRNQFVDLAVAPRIQFPFRVGGTPVAVFVQLPLGIAWVGLDADVMDRKWKTSPAWMFGVNVGVEVRVAPHLGAFASFGWSRHAFRLEEEFEPFPSGSADTTQTKHDIQIQQSMFQMGLSYALSQR